MNNLESTLKELAKSVDSTQYTHILGVSRGGLVPAVYLSHELGLPLLITSYSATKGNGDGTSGEFNFLDNKDCPAEKGQSNVLIVDDIADTGHTLKELYEHCQTMFNIVHTLVLDYRTTSVHTPTYVGNVLEDDAGWVIYPWEAQKFPCRTM